MDKIYQIKTHLVNFIYEKGIDQFSTKELGEIIDMVKDLAQAEESCAEARYYNAVADAMDGSDSLGYTPMRMGYQSTPYNTNQGDMSITRRGYSDASVDSIRRTMRSLDPQSKAQMRRELESLVREM